MDLLSEVAKKVGFKYKVRLVKDGAYGRQDESGNWNGMIGEVVRGVSSAAFKPVKTLQNLKERKDSLMFSFHRRQILRLRR